MNPEFKKLNDIMFAQNEILIKRQEEIKGVWLTLLSGEHGFFYGPPGVAKSMLVEDMARYFPEFNYFYHLMGKTTVPEELFGPVSLTQLKQDKYEHNVESYVPDSEIVFLDEAFKAGATILNTLLRIMNERKFRNGTNTINIPLHSMFAASNEIPIDSELGALYDRFLFRFDVRDLDYAEDFEALLNNEDNIRNFLKDPPVETFTTEEFLKMREEVSNVKLSEDLKAVIVEIRETLRLEHQVTASSRRWLKSLKGIRAHAAMNGRTEAEDMDLVCLTQMLWNRPEEINKIQEVVWEKANPGEYMIRNHRDRITMLLGDMKTAMSKTPQKDMGLLLAEYRSKLDTELNMLSMSRDSLKISDKKRRREIEHKFDYMTRVLDSSKVKLMADVGGIESAAMSQNLEEWRPETV